MIETTEAYGLTFALPTGDSAVGACLRDYGEFSLAGVKLAQQVSRGGAFLDVGANIGAFAIPVSRHAERVVAIEAHRGLADLLERGAAASRCSNIQIVRAAASSARGQVCFPMEPLDQALNYGALGIGTMSDHPAAIPAIPLDDFAAADVKFVKVDVEGHEPLVLEGAPSLLTKVRPSWLIETSDDTPATTSVLSTMRAAGYRLYWFWTPFVGPLAPKRPWRKQYLGDMNIFAVPREHPQPGGMVEAVEGRPFPRSISGFQYLLSFGWRPDQIR